MPHLLKRLELNGFKSFAQKTVMEFPHGITAIVGPNGSGKSNVIDAIRWLLGEREAKNLRGAKVEDLIFAGTVKRPRLGQAQASLHFENKNNLFPVDFAEVAVLRQVNRDGTNQYFLNKQEIRLKDLVDFFAQARLGTKGFTVVTQGNSDVFIESPPLVRREMIEEVLGLREFRLKKNEAERRLKNTVINLEKVKALIDEILPHLRSLKRQTGRWQRRGTIEQELKELEDQFFGSRYQELRDKVSIIEGEIAARSEQAKSLEKERRAGEVRLRDVEVSQPKEREELNEIKKQTQEFLDERSRLEKELGRLEAQIELGKRGPISAPTPQAAKLLDLIKKIKITLEDTFRMGDFEVRQALRGLLSEINFVLSDPQGKNSSNRPADANLEGQLKKINAGLSDIEKKILQMNEREKSLAKGREDFYGSFKAAVAELEAVKEKGKEWERKSQEKLFEKERLDIHLSELHHQITQAGRSEDEFKNVRIREHFSASDLDNLERKILKLRGDLSSIGEVDESLVREARETEERYEFLKRESDDLAKAIADLRKLIVDLNQKIRGEFGEALARINQEFNNFFHLMFGGGQAKLKISNIKSQNSKIREDDQVDLESSQKEIKTNKEKEEIIEEESEEGINIDVRLPRKRITSLEMLSGGERSLVGIAALFALISVSPPPFLVLDEIDAALDDRNARRFAEMLKDFSKKTQFIVVTHNRATMEAADVLYGVTLNDDGTSKVLSLKLESAV